MGATHTTPDGRSSRWDEHRLARRAELVDATLRAIRRHGAGVGMDEVAATARTSKTVFYRHFTDRAGLYTAVAERVDATIIRGLTRAAGDPAPDGARAVVRGVVAAYLRLVDDDPEVYRFIVNAPIVPAGERPEGDVAAGMTGRIAAHVADLVAEGLAGGTPGGTPGGPGVPALGTAPGGAADGRAWRLWGVALVGMVRATADAWLAAGGAQTGPSADELADDLTALIWDGLGAVATSPGRV
ncbi:TetR/AcrR family transcriptional regulator [Fodinibacter luteus]|uniref:TetR/AcrR family transcriptional regulator n=1 Tax=Fodinibacter luteus TaxID=552064 RepID=A0ABP8KMS4_9MICO